MRINILELLMYTKSIILKYLQRFNRLFLQLNFIMFGISEKYQCKKIHKMMSEKIDL